MPDNGEMHVRPASTSPPRIPITPAHVAAIAAAHGVPNGPLVPMESVGIINSLYRLGDRFVLRVPLDHPGHFAQARREALAIPAAIEAGVRTPRLVAYDDSLDIVPAPYLIVEWVDGTSAEALGVVPPDPREAWRQVGADLAQLHASPTPPGLPPPKDRRDPRELVEFRAEDGWISPLEGRRLQAWLDRLAPLVVESSPVFVHGDLQMANVLLDPASHAYLAVVDWGGAGLGSFAGDFGAVPLDAVAPMLQGYRELAVAEPVVTEASILWRRMQLVLSVLPRGAAPGWAWAERPVAQLTDMLLSLQCRADQPWRALGPVTDLLPDGDQAVTDVADDGDS